MSEKNEVKYRLYVLPPDKMDEAEKERFTRATGLYILVYTDKEMEYPEITEEELWRLSENETTWLVQCNVKIMLDEAKKHEAEITASMNEKLDRLEKELKRLRETKE